MRFLTVGSIAIDSIETENETRQKIMGGSAPFSAAASVHFVETFMTGVIGDDYPDEWLERFRKRGVNLTAVERRKGKSFHWHGKYDKSFSCRTSIKTELGVFENYQPSLPENLRSVDFVFLGNIKPQIQETIIDSLQSSCFIAMDTMNCWITQSRESVLRLMKKVNCVFLNDEELELIVGTCVPTTGLEKLRKLGIATAVVKLGKWGSVLLYDNEFFWSPAYPVDNVIDPTGAGDSFAGAFMGCLASYGFSTSRDFKRAMLYASSVSSFTVENFEPFALLNLKKEKIVERFQFLRKLINY